MKLNYLTLRPSSHTRKTGVLCIKTTMGFPLTRSSKYIPDYTLTTNVNKMCTQTLFSTTLWLGVVKKMFQHSKTAPGREVFVAAP